MMTAAATTAPTTPTIILSSEQHDALRDLLERIRDQQINADVNGSECECGECTDGDVQCFAFAGEGIDILDAAVPSTTP
jgi:hypothetical protein